MSVRYFVNPIDKDGQFLDNQHCIIVYDSDTCQTDTLFTDNNTFDECREYIEVLKFIDNATPNVKEKWINSFGMHPTIIQSLTKYITKFYKGEFSAGQMAALLFWQKERLRLFIGAY